MMKPINYLPGSMELEASNHQISDDDLFNIVIPLINANPYIVLLDLSNNNITWKGAKLLSECIRREIDVNLSGNNVHDFGAYFLSKNNYIKRLSLANNNLSPLAYNAYLLNPVILSLDMRHTTPIDEWGVKTTIDGFIYIRDVNFPNMEDFSLDEFMALAQGANFCVIKRSKKVGDCESIMGGNLKIYKSNNPPDEIESDEKMNYSVDGKMSYFFSQINKENPTSPSIKSSYPLSKAPAVRLE